MKRFFLFFVFLFSLKIAIAQRNVILIIADDLGTDYCGFYENYLDTVGMPNIRSLINRGVRFRNAWSNPLCSPTRAGILTGRYSFRTGVGNAIGGTGSTVLDTAEITIPRLLNLFGPGAFASANIGKWHLHLPSPISNFLIPNAMGYDYFEGPFTGALNSYTNWTKIQNGFPVNCTNYATTETANNAISWIKNQNKPFFLWLAFNAPHSPFHLPPSGLYSNTTLSGSATDIAANPQPYFKASLEALDHEIGRMFDSLQFFQKWDSTDVIFIGDNGDDALIAQNTGSAKGSIYEEGIHVPFIISGPSVLNPNRVSDALVNTQDLFASILELFGFYNWPAIVPQNKTIDSKSLLPIILNQSDSIRPWIFSEVFKNPSSAGDGKTIRNRDYKLMDFDNGTQKFFKLTVDPQENNNLLASTMNTADSINYNYLCNEISNLTGLGGYCNLPSELSDYYSIGSNLFIYPNPFENKLKLKNRNPESYYIISDIRGAVIYSGREIEKEDFGYLPKGEYNLTIFNSDKQVFKLIKN